MDIIIDDNMVLWTTMAMVLPMFVRIGVAAVLLLIVTPIVVQLCLAVLVLVVLSMLFISTTSVLLPMRMIYEPFRALLLTMVSSCWLGAGSFQFAAILSVMYMCSIVLSVASLQTRRS